MKYNFNFEKIEIPGFAELDGITIQAEADIEETLGFVKQILPIVREIKSLNMFQTEKDNKTLCEKLNNSREEKREVERELRQEKATADLEKDRLKAKVKELEEKLREAQAVQPVREA